MLFIQSCRTFETPNKAFAAERKKTAPAEKQRYLRHEVA